MKRVIVGDKSHPFLTHKIKQIKIKSLFVSQSPFQGRLHVCADNLQNHNEGEKDSRIFFEFDFAKRTSHCQEKHASFNWQVASVPEGNVTSPHFDKAHMGSDLTEVEEQTCKHVCSCCLLTMSASPALWDLTSGCDICLRATQCCYE